ncbi:hypothetical protein QBC34DRAFT_402097 [Podospora aff. communis PSN243]|uniref:Ecp2 effector protein domain-containing protein n=1 Tax=Podospora aff. communis PSN243 TaxID=3040156 RepID=A0AAV9GSV9_9PEZI|nr:hypothetical protein QBC34DRAFT_402097 [Podospora aff. communis PSN243]
MKSAALCTSLFALAGTSQVLLAPPSYNGIQLTDTGPDGEQSRLSTRSQLEQLARDSILAKPHTIGCVHAKARQLDSVDNYLMALRALGKECDAGATVNSYNLIWVRKGASFAYACNYSGKDMPCKSLELHGASAILGLECHAEGASEEDAKKMPGWVHIQESKMTYGRARYGDILCDNMRRWKYTPVMPVKGITAALDLAWGDAKSIGGRLTPIRDWNEELGLANGDDEM